jgi:sugar/nucleoside kinase (ribokinase family)
MDIMGFGALNVDYVVAGPTDVGYFDDLEHGVERHEEDAAVLLESVDNVRAAGHDLCVQLGGSSLNTLRALSGLAPDLVLGFVGIASGTPNDLPEDAKVASLPDRIEMQVDWQGGQHGVCVSVVNGTERTLSTYNDLSVAAALAAPDRRARLAAQLARARLVHVTSIFGDNAPEYVSELLSETRALRPDIMVSVDLGHVWAARRSAVRPILNQADIVFLNEVELVLLTPDPPTAQLVEQEQWRAERTLSELSPTATRVLVLKKRDSAGRGPDYIGRTGAAMYFRADGSGAVRRHEVMREALGPGQIADSTGAGDVFAAGALAALYSPQVEATNVLQLGFRAARHKMQRVGVDGYDGLGTLALGRSLPAGRGKVFISHSSDDRQLVQVLESLLHAGSPLSRAKQFFCSSVARQGPRPSEPLRRSIWEPLRAADFAVFVITPSFLDSRECTYELGAAAALGIPSIPLLAREIDFDNDLIPVSDRLGGAMADRRALVRVWGHMNDVFGYGHVDQRDFDDLVDAVIAHVPTATPDLMRRLREGVAKSGRPKTTKRGAQSPPRRRRPARAADA